MDFKRLIKIVDSESVTVRGTVVKNHIRYINGAPHIEMSIKTDAGEQSVVGWGSEEWKDIHSGDTVEVKGLNFDGKVEPQEINLV